MVKVNKILSIYLYLLTVVLVVLSIITLIITGVIFAGVVSTVDVSKEITLFGTLGLIMTLVVFIIVVLLSISAIVCSIFSFKNNKRFNETQNGSFLVKSYLAKAVALTMITNGRLSVIKTSESNLLIVILYIMNYVFLFGLWFGFYKVKKYYGNRRI